MLVGGDIFDFGRGFIVVVVEIKTNDLELEVGEVVRIVWCYVNEVLYFLGRLSRKSLEGNLSNVGGRHFSMKMRVSSLMEAKMPELQRVLIFSYKRKATRLEELKAIALPPIHDRVISSINC